MPVAKKGGSLKQEIALAKKRDEEVRQVFCKYDVDNTDSIDMDELTALLDDLGILATLKTSPVDFACKMFSEFDENDDGILSFEEFKGVYNAAKDDAAGKARAPKKYGTESGLDSETQQARRKLAEEKARAKAEEAEKRRKENAELKAKIAGKSGGDAKGLDDDMKRKRRELKERKAKAKAEKEAKIRAENAAMRARNKGVKARTDNDITDDVAADGTVGAGRAEAAAASKARKDADAAQLADENAAMRDRIANTGAATDNQL